MADHRVAILAIDRVVPLDAAIPAQIFGVDELPYRTTLCSVDGGPVRTTSGFSLMPQGDLRTLARADTVIVVGYWPPTQELSEQVTGSLARAHARGRRMVSICVGAFALAAAGVLNGRRAATHWRFADELATRFPLISVDRDVLFVDGGSVLTSAGVCCGIDLCLHIVRCDLGARVANKVARGIVAAPHRSGGQAQFVEQVLPPNDAGSSLARTREWALRRLSRALTVRDLARHAHVSERTFARRFVAETGVTPLQWLLSARIDLARELLESSGLSVERIAARCGLGTPANLRVHFRRAVGVPPSAYRQAFGVRQGLPR
jgi:transcriptional regulator GlxA family with amidase domain